MYLKRYAVNFLSGFLVVFLLSCQSSGDVIQEVNHDEFGNLIDTHKALPCVCPACGVNEQYRAKGSSIRYRQG